MYKQDDAGRNPFQLGVLSGNIRLIQHFITIADPERNIINVSDA